MPTPLPPTHDPRIVEASLLELVIESHPRRLSESVALRRVVTRGADTSEEEVASRALANLVEFGLLRRTDGDCLTATAPAVRAFSLLV